MTGELLSRHPGVERLLEEFLSSAPEERETFLAARPAVSAVVRERTVALLEGLDAGAGGTPADFGAILQAAAQSLGGREGFLPVVADVAEALPESLAEGMLGASRRERVAALLRMGLATRSREEAVEVLCRMDEARERVPGLSADITVWLYLLAPELFPPLEAGLYRGAWEVLGGGRRATDVCRRIWALSDAYAGLLETPDLGVVAAFLRWVGHLDPVTLGKAAAGGEGIELPFFGFGSLVHETLMTPAHLERLEKDALARRFLLFVGPQGSGKTHTAIALARYLGRGDGGYEVMRLHPGATYRDLVGDAERPGAIVAVAERAAKDPEATYAMVLDALDAVDLRSALGDLALAMEYPGLEVTLSGGRRFLWPDNLCVLATAEGEGKDLLSGGHAFLRRFRVVRLGPDPQKLAAWLARQKNPPRRYDLPAVLRNLNRLLEKRTGGRFLLGHGYLMVEGLTDDEVEAYWETTVVPTVLAGLGTDATPEDAQTFALALLA